MPLDNTITVSRDAAGTILVNGGAVAVQGGTPTVANTTLIQVFGQGGNDTITLDEANGALPAANLFGGAGNDTLTGGSGNDHALRPGRQRHPAGQGRQSTCSSAAPATTSSPAATATTRSSARRATTG